MKKVLVVSGHTDLKNSVANSTILGILKEKLPGAEFDLLDSLYPDFRIDVKAYHRCRLDEPGGHRRMTIADVPTVECALTTLKHILGDLLV